MDEPLVFSAGDLRNGLQAEFERDITAADIASFAELSRDWNPLHLNEAYAAQTNYGGRIVHGAFQVAFASAMAGMYLPGRQVVVGSFQCRFSAPLHYPSRVRVRGEITAWAPQSTSGTLRVRVIELPSLTLTSEIHVGFSLHEPRSSPVLEQEAAPVPAGNKPIVLITGASGGLGHNLASVLSKTYHVIGMARSLPASSDRMAGLGVEWIPADLTSGDWEQIVARNLRGRHLYGVVHAAWPSGPQGSLLDVETDAVGAQVEFGTVGTIRLARFLKSQAAGPSRLVVLGTVAATVKPVLNMAAYSLGKAALEHTVRLLAPELARSDMTINLVAPSFVPVGMNSSKTNKVKLTETAKVPMGRLCSPEDVSRAVEFLLSSGAAFVTGQILPLTGGEL
jgi:NAD(P)-dependent dehydrogenase (short-subunit alcohol dehydrogenase family)/acyl dehydratase